MKFTFAKRGAGFRLCEGNYPYLSPRVPFILIHPDGVVECAKSKTDKKALLSAISEGDLLLSVWPGEWSSDTFIVDPIGALKEMLQ